MITLSSSMFKPTSFSPILAIIGVIFILFINDSKKKDVGTIFIGFAILMYGMDMMSSAVKPLAEVPEFTNLLLKFSNPLLRCSGRCTSHCSDPVIFCICRYSAGTVSYRCSAVQCSNPDHYGTEHRYLYHSDPFCNRCEKECQTCSSSTSLLST